MGDDAAALLSAGVAFYMFLSVFPAMLAALTVYGLVADPAQVEEQITSILARSTAGRPRPDRRAPARPRRDH